MKKEYGSGFRMGFIEVKKYFFIWFPLFFIPAIFILTVSYQYYLDERKKAYEQTILHETSVVNSGKITIEKVLEAIHQDIVYLSDYHEFKRYINTHQEYPNNDILNDYKLLMLSNPNYDQIRWIDETGWEKIRVNNRKERPESAPVNALQYKGDRYYFKNVVNHSKGYVYISPFDLNFDHGVIEKPYKPIIRFAMPVVDDHNHSRGVFVMSFLGKNLLDMLIQNTNNTMGTVMLLNRDGYWLKGRTPKEEFGFMFGNKNLTLAVENPPAWRVISSKKNGTFTDKNGLWTFETLYPFYGYQWKVVTFVPLEKVYGSSDERIRPIFISTFAILLIVMIGSFVITYFFQRQRQSIKVIKNLSASIEQMDDIIYITDKKGYITYVNKAFCRHIGYTKDEAVGKHSRMTKSGKHKKEFYEDMWNTINEGKVFKTTIVNRKKDGSLYYEKKTITPLVDESNVIIGFVSTGKDVTEDVLRHQEMTMIASTDVLTGIYNRRKLEELFTLEMERSKRFDNPLSIVLIDIDHFKSINDTYGHDTGDNVLIQLANFISANIRKIDIFARWGGEEFVIICPGTNESEIMHFAEKIRSSIALGTFEEVGHITISAGVAVLKDAETFTEVFKRADQALYEAKTYGRDQVRFAK